MMHSSTYLSWFRRLLILGAVVAGLAASAAGARIDPGVDGGLRWQWEHQMHSPGTAARMPPLPRYYGSQAPYASTPRTQPLPAYYGSTAPYRPTITRTQPLPAYYGTTAPYASEASLPSAQGLRADGLRWQGLARVYEQTHVRARAASTSTSNGFAWGDAGIGLAAGIGAMLLAGAAAIALRKQGRLATQ